MWRRSLIVVGLAGCGSLSTYRTAEPIARGHTRYDLAVDVGSFRDRAQDTRTPAAHVELAARHGVTATTDVTLKLYVPGAELGVQHALGGGRWRWAIAAALGGARTKEGGGSTDALYGHLRLTALATRRTSARWAFTVGPVVTGGVFAPRAGGHAEGLLLGGFANAAWRFGGCWQVVPELSLHVTAAGEVPVRGTVAQLGVAIGRGW
ncbi:MAG: hypothetical protein IPH44_19525 [Myxococcales bacterium]|nr:hypothetical protein [Myxococcales bacterium]MBK7195040.1 hypothetical protein [Myxococcales bacterium]MBP6842438.1 hypothetical protein [Kofleriaceae bacterium]